MRWEKEEVFLISQVCFVMNKMLVILVELQQCGVDGDTENILETYEKHTDGIKGEESECDKEDAEIVTVPNNTQKKQIKIGISSFTENRMSQEFIMMNQKGFEPLKKDFVQRFKKEIDKQEWRRQIEENIRLCVRADSDDDDRYD